MTNLDGKVAIVTGAGQGVGRGIALAMAREGAAIAVTELNPDTCRQVVEEIRAFGGRALEVVCNVRQRRLVQTAVAATAREFGTVDILVNNAQAHRQGLRFEDTTDDDMALALESGLMATFYFMQACFPYFREHGGKIINLASAAGTEGHAGNTAYATAKEGIRALTKVAAHEWGKYRINVNAICPLADSPGWEKAPPGSLKMTLRSVPLGRMGDPEKDIGRAVVFLASADSDYITGHTMTVDGGQTILR
ncbi:MAG: SDR family NAD(P)-dependent oxidoreductase [Chloroflexi bacterium]|nr:SDR family NAD(P)-dependent oxidoreductase [Chloroflexota bacterium]